MNKYQLLRYNRHILLPQIDLQGQQRIIDSRVMVIGCGGLGCAVAPVLAAAGIGTLSLVDDDRVELSNLQRQTYYTPEDIGQFKVEVMARFIHRQNCEVTVHTHTHRLSSEELHALVPHHDVILDCSDNLLTRQLVSKVAFLEKVPLVFASATRFEGQLSVFDSNDEASPCYACLFNGQDTEQDNCSFTGVFSPLVSMMGAMQTSEALKVITGIGRPAVGRLIHYNALDLGFYALHCARNPDCEVCGHSRG